MAYGEFYVEHQGWARWPKTLIMCRKRGYEIIERRRYVPERTCTIESSFLNDFSNNHECWWEFDLSCGHHITGDTMDTPNYCEVCGAKVVGE